MTFVRLVVVIIDDIEGINVDYVDCRQGRHSPACRGLGRNELENWEDRSGKVFLRRDLARVMFLCREVAKSIYYMCQFIVCSQRLLHFSAVRNSIRAVDYSAQVIIVIAVFRKKQISSQLRIILQVEVFDAIVL